MVTGRRRARRPGFEVVKSGAAYFDEHPQYSRFDGEDPAAQLAPYVEPGLERELRRAAAAGVSGGVAVEIGAGFGLGQRLLIGYGFRYVPCDISADILGRFHQDSCGHSFAAFWEALPLRDGACDLVLALDVIEHLPDPRPAIREAARVLRPGGALIIKTPNPLGAAVPLFHPFRDPTHWSVLPKERWEHALSDGGFRIRSSRSTLTIPGLWRISPRLATPLPLPKVGPDITILATSAQ